MEIKISLIICLFVTTMSCDIPDHYFSKKPECNNIDNFFKESSPNSAVYQDKVRLLLTQATPKEFRYFFQTFKGESKDYMVVNFRNKNHCFDADVLVTDWSKLAGMRKVNGEAYPKELYDLKWELQTINGKEEILYLNMHDIID